MTPSQRKKIYDYLATCGLVLNKEQHYFLKKLLNEPPPEKTEEEIEKILEGTIVDEE